ncbi:DNA internalization-related competence protein ComEC/Rec2, partial [hydrothermal vent metagenome]
DVLYDHGAIKTKNDAYLRFLKTAKRDGKYKALKAGDRIEFKGGLVMDVLSPSPDAISGNSNNNSLVVKLTYGKVKVLLTGDIESEVERVLLDSGIDLSADILKIAHHGSRSSSATEFLKRVGAKTAIISAGRNNSFGHPADETLRRLENANLKIYRTDISGEIVMTTDGSMVEWMTYRENAR